MSKAKKNGDFRPNEFVVYPAHGVGKIVSIEEQERTMTVLLQARCSERELFLA